MEFKTCSKCKVKKPLHKFNADISKPTGVQSLCRDCSNRANRDYYVDNKHHVIEKQRVYRKTPQGRKVKKKSKAKRKRELGWYEIRENPMAFTEWIVYHHITDEYVVAVPEDIHQHFAGKTRQRHRDLMQWVVEQLYPNIYDEV